MYKILFLLVLISCSHHKSHKHQNHGFNDAQAWEKVFESRKRDSWQKPGQIIKLAGVKRDSIVADIGSGTGYFPVKLASKASRGRVWGSDIEKNMVNFLNKRAHKEKIKNLFSILGTYDDPMLPEPVDYIFMINTYHHIENRVDYFRKLRSKILSNGKIVIIDFKKKNLPFGPPLKMKISRDEIVRELTKAGYYLSKESNMLEYQNMLIFSLRN